MSLYAIGDLHLSLKVNKPMDVFGPGWADHVRRLEEGFSRLGEDDVTVLCGDTSWGIDFEESLEDFTFIDRLPEAGHKGQPRLLVEHRRENETLFRGERYYHH